ncbi:MAG: thioredoxin [Chloroflexi bacterium]|nr:thioredoxin [Chloroflexota bacterium]
MSRETTDKSFEADVLKATTPVVVDFWAAWCGPCQVLAPVVEELAQEYRGKVEFIKLNVDENPATTAKYGIQGIPTLLLFKGGEIVDIVVGAAPKREIKKHLDATLASIAA